MQRLKKLSTRAPENFDKDLYKKKTLVILQQLKELQAVLFAESKHSVLIILQGLDASGKDGAVKNVFSVVNPMGCDVKAFKAPTEEERAHDFLWRIHKHTPAKGIIQIFNRSHYEDVLVPSVEKWIDEKETMRRYKHINSFEALLKDSGTHIFKFYLHISPEEQQKRFAERITDPEKRWKYKSADLAVAKKWDEYRVAYEAIFENCEQVCPWNLIPSDQNWYKDYLIAKTIVDYLDNLKMEYPQLEENT
jgi:PPK2 family polyphosphate:nucleotide phosphotransferase